LRRDQIDLVRDELARFCQVNQDLTILQAELAARSAGAGTCASIASAEVGAVSSATNDALARIEALLQRTTSLSADSPVPVPESGQVPPPEPILPSAAGSNGACGAEPTLANGSPEGLRSCYEPRFLRRNEDQTARRR
jgi:hypothetical protein